MEVVRVRRVAAALVVTVGVATGGQLAHAQTPPPSLVRTLLAASESPLAASGDITVTYSCDMVVGGSLSVSYTASGTAVGPYSGAFTETGTVTGVVRTADPDTGIAKGDLTSWHADFTIDSTLGDVVGTKTLDTSTLDTSVGFACFDGGFRGQPYDQENASAIARVTYEATIRTSDGVFRDAGTATSDVAGSKCTQAPGPIDYCADLDFEYLAEDFVSSNGVSVPPPDTDTNTDGASTGGGRVLPAAEPSDAVAFGFTVRSVDDRLRGTCNVLDQQAGVHVRCRTVDSYVQVGSTATWTGTADVNGVLQRYRISVQDSGEPNRADRFTIVTDTYSTSGPVIEGNVQVHRPGVA